MPSKVSVICAAYLALIVRENRDSQERTSNRQVPSQAGVKSTFQSQPEWCVAVKKEKGQCVKVISTASKVVCCLALSDEEEIVFGAEFLSPLGSRHVFALNASPLMPARVRNTSELGVDLSCSR